MKKFGLFCLFALVGCNHNGGGSGAFDDRPQGTYVMEKELAPDDSSMYTVGCSKDGKSLPQIDPRLRPGMEFKFKSQIMEGANPSISGELSKVVVSVDMKTLVEKWKLLSVWNIPGLQAGMTTTATGTLRDDGGIYNTFNPQIPDFKTPVNHCMVQSSSFSQHKHYGSFKTASGQTFAAYKVIDHVDGDIICNGRSIGEGAQDYVRIASNDIPSFENSQFCGGVHLFYSYHLKKKGGTSVFREAYEVTSVAK